MSIRYTLRTLKESDVNLLNLKRHEMCLTETGKVMIRLHNDQIVDLSGAAAQYATTVANTILSRGSALETKINNWSALDNQAIQTFNSIYNEVKDDKDAVELLLEEVNTAKQQALSYRNTAQTAATNANNAKAQAETIKSQVQTLKTDVQELKQSAQSSASQARSSASNAANYSSNASTSASQAQAYASAANSSAQSAMGYSNSAVSAKNSAQTYATSALNSAELASQAQRQAGQSALQASASETNAKTSEDNAKDSETSAKASELSALNSAASASASAISAANDAERIEAKEDTITEILEAHANIISITNEEIDDIWDDLYVPEGTGIQVDGDGIYCMPIPIPYIESLFTEG